MVLGFISLLLTVFQPVVASLCMPERLKKSMLPCAYDPNANETSTCAAGEVQIISVESLHQIHLFIFVLAIVHVCYSCITVLLGFLKVKIEVSTGLFFASVSLLLCFRVCCHTQFTTQKDEL
jgi:mlo protein